MNSTPPPASAHDEQTPRPWSSAPIPELRGVTDFELLGGQRPVAVVRLERRVDVLPLRVPQRTHVIWWENVRWRRRPKATSQCRWACVHRAGVS